jgi:cytochrome c5
MKSVVISVFALILFGCSPRMASSGPSTPKTPETPVVTQAAPSPEPVPDELAISGAVITTENKGQSLFEQSCGRCHKLPDPAAYTKEEWVPIVQNMRFRARLTVEEGNQVYDYVASLAKS